MNNVPTTLITCGVTYAQLLEDLRALIRYELTQLHPTPSPTVEEDKLLTVAEAAVLLDVYPQTVHE